MLILDKKIIIFSLFILYSILLCGCKQNYTPNDKNEINYSSVDQYELAMNAVQDSKPGFEINCIQYYPDGYSLEYTTYKKGNMWKDVIHENGKKYEAFMSNGNEAYGLTKSGKYKKGDFSHSMLNGLYDWNAVGDNQIKSEDILINKKFKNQNESINGYKCRMITYEYKNGINVDTCIDDNTGIAVYHKEYGNVSPEYKDIYVKVKNINIKNLKDTEFIPKNN